MAEQQSYVHTNMNGNEIRNVSPERVAFWFGERLS